MQQYELTEAQLDTVKGGKSIKWFFRRLP